VVEDKRALQVTHFHRPDTTTGTLRGRHLFFRASANPFGTNPGENCQVFSVNTLGGDLRQLTRFRDDARPSVGCNWDFGGVACAIEGIVLDQVTGTVIFGSSCDPFGMNPYGFQLFSMRPDGSGLRQLTATRGRVIEPDGAVSFQTVGPIAYPARARPEPPRGTMRTMVPSDRISSVHASARRMPSLRIRDWSVVRLRPRRAAAPSPAARRTREASPSEAG